MKKYFLIFTLLLSFGAAGAATWNMNDNPFPQTSPQNMNNIYESEPATIAKEQKKAKKSWFRTKNVEPEQVKELPKIPVYPVPHEGVRENGDYYIFTTGN